MPLTRAELRELTQRMLLDTALDNANPVAPEDLINAELYAGTLQILREVGEADFYMKGATEDATAAAIAMPEDYLCNLQVWFNGSNSQQRFLLRTRTASDMYAFNPSWDTYLTTGNYPSTAVLIDSEGILSYQLWPLMNGTIANGVFIRYRVKPADWEDDDETMTVFTYYTEIERKIVPAAAAINCLKYDADSDGKDKTVLAQIAKLQGMYDWQLAHLRGSINMQFKTYPTYGSR